jgi:single-strand DNA-binding protein
VSAWRGLAENAEHSLGKGDPVLVHGKLNHRTYINKQGVEVVALEIEAITIGHDLTRGTSRFRRVVRSAETPARTTPEPPDFGPSVYPPPEDPYAEQTMANGPAPEGAEEAA